VMFEWKHRDVHRHDKGHRARSRLDVSRRLRRRRDPRIRACRELADRRGVHLPIFLSPAARAVAEAANVVTNNSKVAVRACITNTSPIVERRRLRPGLLLRLSD
jgi:hypothetical protein